MCKTWFRCSQFSVFKRHFTDFVKSSHTIACVVKYTIQSRCNRSLSLGSKCHYLTRLSFSRFIFSVRSPPHIRFHHFHQSMRPFPRDNSSVSVIYLLFGHFSYVIRLEFFFHSIYLLNIPFYVQHWPIFFAM